MAQPWIAPTLTSATERGLRVVSERRLAPRVGCQIAAEVSLYVGPSIDVTILDISTVGCQIAGDGSLLNLDSLVGGTPLELEIAFGLEGESVHARCRLIHKRRESQTRCVAGLRWTSLVEHHLALIRRFVEQQSARSV